MVMMRMMIKQRNIFLLAFLLLPLLAGAQTNDFGTWWGVEVRKKLPKNFRVSLQVETRLNENSRYLRDVYIEPGVQYKPLKWLSLGLQYRFDNRYQRLDDYFLQRHRVSFDLEFAHAIKRFEFEFRNRVQLSWDNYYSPSITYPIAYNRCQLGGAFKWPQLPLRTLLSGELWIPLEQGGEPDRFRLVVAQEVTIRKAHKLQLRFLFQTDVNDNTPLRQYILSTRYIYTF